jgi:two-component system NtrC family sensor kinase
MKRRFISLRTKLIASFLAVILLGGALSLVFGSRLVRDTILSQARDKVRHELVTARIIYDETLNVIRQTLHVTSRREGVIRHFVEKDYDILGEYLRRIREDNAFDVLTLTDGEGTVVLRASENGAEGDSVTDIALVREALAGREAWGTVVLTQDQIEKEGRDLALQALIDATATPHASGSPSVEGGAGMFLMAAMPVPDDTGKVLGALYGGVLLNRNFEIVDRIQDVVYGRERYEGVERGTATIFLDTKRVATNVMNKMGKRAVGTLVSETVAREVLEGGRTYVGRAFVVGDWYITAYDPIRDPEGAVIGMLYVGTLERPYLDAANRVMLTFTGIAVLCVILLLVILYFSTARIVRPLQDMVEATEKISRGDLTHTLPVSSADEVGLLSLSFNRMTDTIRAAKDELVGWGTTLEKKVEERTRELREMQHQMIQSEKLASLGKLSTGIAHEINNPLGGVLMYAHLIRENMDPADPNYENVNKIIKETTRCKDIVKDLLEFARPKEPTMEIVNINAVLERSLDMLVKQAVFQNVEVTKSLAGDIPTIIADGDQLQQVFMNIIINACEAMEGGGRLKLSTHHDEINRKIIVEIEDTGCGIPEENTDRVFEPFFTTKEVGKGTGLGLAVSYGIITKHRGTISVESEDGQGATFVIKLPLGTEEDEKPVQSIDH